jgi:hypothetical protein
VNSCVCRMAGISDEDPEGWDSYVFDCTTEEATLRFVEDHQMEIAGNVEVKNLVTGWISVFFVEVIEYSKKYTASLINEYRDPMSMWWGYLHSNKTIQVKTWHGDHADYTTDCDDNPFVLYVVPPFEAKTREEAEKIITEKIKTNFCV